jgi:2-hydroxy-3-keto-5-methylthiopentenyl-1-phosphate phosphatase
MKSIILIDFDGTIINEDSVVLILEQFASGNWRKYDDLLLADEITLEECLKKQFATVTESEEEIIAFLQSKIVFRVGFPEFIAKCTKNKIPLLIVSAGIDFVIKYSLTSISNASVPLVTAKITSHSAGYAFNFPPLKYPKSKNFKEDLVKQYKRNNYQVTFIGDGIGDYYAIKGADYGYVVSHSELEGLCKRKNVPYISFNTFEEIEI